MSRMSRTGERLQVIFDLLLDRFGPQGWWPGDTPLEIAVGAVLTQNTSWRNVERAIANLTDAGLLSLPRLLDLPVGLLAEYIRPAGYHNLKAARLRNLLNLVADQYGGSLEALFDQSAESLREELLGVKGIGPETADAISLYAAGKPVFVADAYTHRILSRHGIIDEDCDYACMRALFMDNLPEDAAMFGEYHALIVRVGKEFCGKTKMRCEGCPLREV